MVSRTWTYRLVPVALILAVWFYATGPGGASSLLLPEPASIASALIRLVSTPDTWIAVGITVLEVVTAFAISVTVTFVVVIWASRTSTRARIFEPLLGWGYMVPSVVFFPLFVLWFGIDSPSKIAYAVFGSFFPMAFTALRGLRSVDPKYVSVASAFGASKSQLEWMVKFPAALPVLLSAVRIGAALSLIYIILGEMLAANRGLGYLITRSTQFMRIPETFALIAITLLIVAAYYPIVSRIGKAHRKD